MIYQDSNGIISTPNFIANRVRISSYWPDLLRYVCFLSDKFRNMSLKSFFFHVSEASHLIDINSALKLWGLGGGVYDIRRIKFLSNIIRESMIC